MNVIGGLGLFWTEKFIVPASASILYADRRPHGRFTPESGRLNAPQQNVPPWLPRRAGQGWYIPTDGNRAAVPIAPGSASCCGLNGLALQRSGQLFQ